MTFDEAMEADTAVILAVQNEQEAIANMVREADSYLDGHREVWVPTGLDTELLAELADRILARRRLMIGTTKT